MSKPLNGRDGLPGPQGPQGKQGIPGLHGKDGQSIYDLARQKGFEGDEQAFLDSLKGAQGDVGPIGPTGPEGAQGPAGKDGAHGRNGIDGEPGRTGQKGAQGPVGPRGATGPEGPQGPMPRHIWEGTVLRWEQPSGEFDEGVDLKGPPGKNGRDGIGGGESQSGVPEAPVDGSPYWRKDAAWEVAVTGGSATWGAIVGTLSSQTDLQNALNAKANTASLASVATSGAYDDLSGKPTLGTAASHAATDFATSTQGSTADSAVQPGDLAGVATSGAYSDLTGAPSLGSIASHSTSDFIATTSDIHAVAVVSSLPGTPNANTLYFVTA